MEAGYRKFDFDNLITSKLEDERFNALLPALYKKGKMLNTTDGYTMEYDGHIPKKCFCR